MNAMQKLEKMRKETARISCADVVLEDGTVIVPKEQGLAVCLKLDEAISLLRRPEGVPA